MAGLPEEEHLLSRVRSWFTHLAGRFFWPSNEHTESPDAESPDDNKVIDDPPVPPDNDRAIENPLVLPDYEEEEEEERDVVALEVERMVAHIRRDVENANGQGRIDHQGGEEQPNFNDGQNARPPSPPLQQFPPPNFRMDWRQQGPVYDLNPFAYPYAFPQAQPFIYPHAHPLADPYAQPFAFPPFPPPAFFYAAPRPELHAPPQPEPHVVPEESGNKMPEIENIGPLSSEQTLEFFGDGSCLEEDPESPSTSGSSAKRRREESDVEQAASKRLRRSDESDEDLLHDALHG